MRSAVVLFSGGLDSSTCLAIAREDGFAPHALAVRYGQRHDYELTAAERVARALGAPLKVVSLDLRAIGGSALTGDLEVPKDAPIGGGVPLTHAPAGDTGPLPPRPRDLGTGGAPELSLRGNANAFSRVPGFPPAF